MGCHGHHNFHSLGTRQPGILPWFSLFSYFHTRLLLPLATLYCDNSLYKNLEPVLFLTEDFVITKTEIGLSCVIRWQILLATLPLTRSHFIQANHPQGLASVAIVYCHSLCQPGARYRKQTGYVAAAQTTLSQTTAKCKECNINRKLTFSVKYQRASKEVLTNANFNG